MTKTHDRPWKAVIVAGTLALAGSAAALAEPVDTAPSVDAAPALDTDLATRTFDEAWRLVYETHFDPEFNGVDWVALGEELRPKAAEAETVDDLRDVLNDMLSRLGQSHFVILPDETARAMAPIAGEPDDDADDDDTPAEQADSDWPPVDPRREGHPGFETRIVDGRAVVVSVTPGSPAAEHGVRPGWVLTKVGRRAPDDLVQAMERGLSGGQVSLYALQVIEDWLGGSLNSPVNTEFLDENDEPVSLRLRRGELPGVETKFGNLPTMRARLEHERLDADGLDDGVGLIRFNIWLMPVARAFSEAAETHRDADGWIIDLRGNLGGILALPMNFSGHFMNVRTPFGQMKTRDTTLNLVPNPRFAALNGARWDPFDGPVAILVDGASASASEVFSGGLQSIGRVRVFGERTPGATLPAAISRLPNGDVLMHAFADFLDAGGVSLEGRGVEPDEHAPHSREALLDGRDLAVEAAVRWIAEQQSEAAPKSH